MISRGKLKGQKRRISPFPKPGYTCKWCGNTTHFSMSCFQRPKKPIAKEADYTRKRRLATRRAWFNANKPNTQGLWSCYLKIAPECPKMVGGSNIELEHVRSKTRSPKLKFEILNIKAACGLCNKLKGSWSLEDLAATYPHIFDMITTSEWVEYERQLTELENSP